MGHSFLCGLRWACEACSAKRSATSVMAAAASRTDEKAC